MKEDKLIFQQPGALAQPGKLEQDQLRQELETERALLEAVLRQMPAGVIIVEAPSGKVLLANEQFESMVRGRSHEENVPLFRDWKGFHIDDMRPYEPEEWPLERCLASGEVVSNEKIYVLRKDDVCGTWSVNAAPIRDGAGQIVAAVAIITDITVQQQVANELRKLSRAVEQSPSTVLITDIRGNIEYVNPKFTSLTGYDAKEVIGKNPRILKSGMTPAEEYRGLWEAISSGGEWRGEMLNKKRNGELYWEFASISAIKNTEGEITHFLAVKEDITERKRAEEFRDEYVSLIGHDLRSPLTTIVGQAQWVKRKLEQAGMMREAVGLEAVVKNAKRMSTLIDDILNSARLEAGCLELHQDETDLIQLVSEVAERLDVPDERERIRVDVPEYVPPVSADRGQLERAIANLLTNALKYSPAGSSVLVTISQRGQQAIIAVADEGPGIAPEDIPYLFDRYYRARSGKKTEGLGLGLYITRLIVAAHGGSVWVESTGGEGSTFYLSLPLEREQR